MSDGAAAAPVFPGRQAQFTLTGVMTELYLEIHSEEDFFATVFLAAVFLDAAFSAVFIPDASCG